MHEAVKTAERGRPRNLSGRTLDEACVLFKVAAPQRRRTEGSDAVLDRFDRRNVKSERANDAQNGVRPVLWPRAF
jgi:hypothetical protein